jgi:hypothetical protein
MTFDEFDRVTDEIFHQVLKMRDTKGKEYARSEDRFANFNRLAAELGLKREHVLWVYTAKHLDGIVSYVNNGRAFSTERVEGRIVDAITYLLLLAGMVRENDKQAGLPSAADLDAHVEQLPIQKMKVNS